MSQLSVRGEQSTSTEVTALTNLAALATSSAGEFIRKTGTNTFENATPSDAVAVWGSITGTLLNQLDLQAVLNGKSSTTLNNLGTTSINASFLFDTDATYDIGSLTVGINDLHFGLGGVINFDGSDVTLTHSVNTLTLAGGNLALGTNSLTMTGSLGETGSRLTKGWFTDLEVTNAIVGSIAGSAATLTTTRTIWGQNFNGSANVTGTLALGTADLTMTGSIAATGSRVTKGWFTDLESTNDITINGTALATTYLAKAGGTLSGSITLGENTGIALDPAGSADGKWSGITIAGTAGYSQSFGDLVYLDPTDSRWETCDANSASGADGDSRGIIGMVVVAGTDGNACTILLFGQIRADAKFPSMTINAPMYVSETAGSITGTIPTTTDAVQRVVGFALTADELFFNPNSHYQTGV